MKIGEIREFAKAMGIKSVNKFKNKEDLIHTIQLAEGNIDCFKQIPDCTLTDCKWYEDCVENNA